MVTGSEVEAIKKSSELYRAAKLALLRAQARTTIERTDASALQVEEALARLSEATTLTVFAFEETPGLGPSSESAVDIMAS
jgi:hypothetical protein